MSRYVLYEQTNYSIDIAFVAFCRGVGKVTFVLGGGWKGGLIAFEGLLGMENLEDKRSTNSKSDETPTCLGLGCGCSIGLAGHVDIFVCVVRMFCVFAAVSHSLVPFCYCRCSIGLIWW
jgi:hypothetical protein